MFVARSGKMATLQNGRIYLIPNPVVAGEAALQFYGDKGEVIWTAPTSPTYIPVK
jgi:hypothetical protein